MNKEFTMYEFPVTVCIDNEMDAYGVTNCDEYGNITVKLRSEADCTVVAHEAWHTFAFLLSNINRTNRTVDYGALVEEIYAYNFSFVFEKIWDAFNHLKSQYEG